MGQRLVSILFIILLTSSLVSAETISWSGLGGSWSASANWSPAKVPVWGDDVVISYGVGLILVDSEVNIKSLTLSGDHNVELSIHEITINSPSPAAALDTGGFNASGTYPGMAITDVDNVCGGGHNGEADAVATQADGKIVVVGTAYNCGHRQFIVARYKTDGTLDNGFGTNGVARTQIDNDSSAYAVAIQADQKIVVAGYSGHSGGAMTFAVARYNTDGSLDTNNFNPLGTQPGTVSIAITGGSGADDEAYAIAIQSDGKIVVAGYSFDGAKGIFAVARFTTAGVLDSSFATSGVFTHAFGTSSAQAFALAIQPADQKIIVAGFSVSGSNNNFTVMRLTTAGALDSAFNTTGIVTTAVGSYDNYAQSVALQSDNKIVVGGYAYNGSNNDFAVVRYTTGGVLDTSFNLTGKVTTAIGSQDDRAFAVAIQPGDQKIVAAGYAFNGGSLIDDFALVRYCTDGSLDTTFGTAGKVTTLVGSGIGESQAYGLAIQSDGKIVAAGYNYNGSIWSFATLRYWP
jgi:uncharacterized delta-60 repeat protein